MPATFVSTTPTGNPVLDAIDGDRRWDGVIAYNRVDPNNPVETGAFASNLPSPYTTQAIGLTNPIWDLVVRQLGVMRGYANISFEFSDAADANYFASDFARPDNANVAGIAARPGVTPILAFNVGTWNTYSDQQQ